MVKVKSELACLVVLSGISVNPQWNRFDESELEKLKENSTFNALVASDTFFIVTDVVEAPVVVEIKKSMNAKEELAELRKRAEDAGIDTKGLNKAELEEILNAE